MKNLPNNLKFSNGALKLKLIIEDTVIMLIRCLIATILCSICMQKGWIFSTKTIDVSYDMFWKIYSSIFAIIPIVLFYKGFAGKYNIIVKKYTETTPLGTAQMADKRKDGDE